MVRSSSLSPSYSIRTCTFPTGLLDSAEPSSSSSSTAGLLRLLPDLSFLVGDAAGNADDPRENHERRRRPEGEGVVGGVGTFDGPAVTDAIVSRDRSLSWVER